jgi:DNA-binding transcriptional LysR family regulator
MSEISDLRLLAHLVSAGSLSEASRRLHSSPPALSRRLAAMEERLGIRLIDRTSRHFGLTQEGGILHERALHILTEIDDAEAEASARGQSPRGRLRIGAPMQIGRESLAALISLFSRRYPNIIVEFVLSDAVFDVVAEEFDVAMMLGLPNDPSVIARRIMSSRLVVCASPEYFGRHGTPEKPDDLLLHNCLCPVRGRRPIDHWRFRVEGQPKVVEIKGSLSSTSGDVLRRWAIEGRGIALKAHWDVKTDLDGGRLVECLSAYAGEEIGLYLIYASKIHLPPRVRAFVDFIVEALAGHPNTAPFVTGKTVR